MKSDDNAVAKKPYHRPVLEVYGDIRKLTRNISPGMNMNDNAGGGPEKTSPP